MHIQIASLLPPLQLRIILSIGLATIMFGCKEVQEKKDIAPKTIALETAQDSSSLYEDLEGNPVALSDFKGKRILLNYWATWCRPCIEEMPALENLQDMLAHENYVFLFASDQSVQKISKFKKSRGFDFTYLKYNGIYANNQISALPVTFLFNTNGEQVLRFDGGMAWDSPEIIEQLRKLP